VIAENGNAPAYKPGSKKHLESFFIKLNEPNGQRALWLRWTIFAEPGLAPRAECWGIAFERGRRPRAVKRSMILDASMIRSPLLLDFGGMRFDGRHAVGEIVGPNVSLSWQFDLDPRIEALQPYPYNWMYRGKLPEQKVTSPIPDASVRGVVHVDGERWDVSGWRGMQGHNWGTRHTYRYAWCQATGFNGHEDLVFEGGSGRLFKAGMELPWITMVYLFIDGRWERFDRPASIMAARASVSVMRWSFETRSERYQVRGVAHTSTDQAVGLHYGNPDGSITYCLNSKLADLTLEIDGPSGSRTFSTSRAALELGWPTADHGVIMAA
jgi:hypothetical protein